MWVITTLKQPTITIRKCPQYFCSLIYGYLTFPNVSSTAGVSSTDIVRVVENANTSLTERGILAAFASAVASVPLPQHVHWEHGQERFAMFL